MNILKFNNYDYRRGGGAHCNFVLSSSQYNQRGGMVS